MTKWYLVGAGAIIVLGAAWWLQTSRTPVAQVATPQENTGSATTTTTTVTSTANPQRPSATKVPFVFSLINGERVGSWSFSGAYTGNPELVQKAQAQITNLRSKLGSGEYTDYQLYVSIANQYGLLGDGAGEFAALQKALGIDSQSTGLAWSNMGNLLARLGAYASARLAYERAVAVEPIAQYQQALAQFNAEHPPQAQ